MNVTSNVSAAVPLWFRGRRAHSSARRSIARRLLIAIAFGVATAFLAPSTVTAVPLVIVVITLCLMVLFRRMGSVPSHVWAPVVGAVVATTIPYVFRAAFGVELGAVRIGALVVELQGHLGVPVLILALAYLAVSLDDSGFFRWAALHIIRLGDGRGRRLLVGLFVGVSLVTLVTSNDIVILAMTPILVYLGAEAGIENLTPFLLTQFIAANTASMGLYIGNPTNIVIGRAAGVDFLGYAQRMLLPTVVATVVALVLVVVVFGWASRRNRVPVTYRVPAEALRPRWSRQITIKVGVLGVCLVSLALCTTIPVGGLDHTWLLASVALSFTVLAFSYDVTKDRRDQSRNLRTVFVARMRRIPFEIVPFYLGFCVLVAGLDHAGIAAELADYVVAAFEHGPVVGSVATAAVGVAAVNLTNNIPASILISKTWLRGELAQRLTELDPSYSSMFVDASLYASNFGANLTIFGALAGLMWLQILRQRSGSGEAPVHVATAGELLKYGLLIVPLVTLATCLAIATLHSVSP